MYFTTIENSMRLFFSKFVKLDLDPDPHGSAFILPPGSGSGSAKNECGSTALPVVINFFQIVLRNSLDPILDSRFSGSGSGLRFLAGSGFNTDPKHWIDPY